MRFLSLLAVIALLMACGKPSPNTLKVGTIAGPETELVEIAQKVALERYGIVIKIVQFNDYNLPNAALQDGSLDANIYQHLPYLNAANKAHGYHLEAIGKTFVYPAGIYSKKIKSLQQLPMNATIAIPNDPSNEMRALLLLQKANLITLKNTHPANKSDVLSNPKKLHMIELDAAQLPRALADVDAAVINTNFAIPAGLSPSKNALFLEDRDSPYANLIVIRHDNAKKEQIYLFVKAMNSKPVAEKAKALFGDAALPAWR